MSTNRIREIRLALGLTLDDIGDAIGTSGQQISRLERGQRRLTDDYLTRIAEVLGVPPTSILSQPEPDPARVLDGTQKKVRLSEEEIALVRFWRLLDPSTKRMVATLARDRGLEILAGYQPQPGPVGQAV
jgi:transcriptional regulator with XRE-family HTH domain